MPLILVMLRGLYARRPTRTVCRPTECDLDTCISNAFGYRDRKIPTARYSQDHWEASRRHEWSQLRPAAQSNDNYCKQT